ncbi:MAG: hypothetical protein KDD50_00530 [Bdellovibrionales bacterium]|nr:hypothetical protein [Bdellovibrionales bacterium]
MKKLFMSVAGTLLLVLSSLNAIAAEDLVPDKQEKLDEIKMGWNHLLKLTGNVAINSSKDVVGQQSGDSNTYGLELTGKFSKKTEKSEWRNGLGVKGATTRTPALPKYIKSSDELKIDSLYLYHLESYPSIGPYGKFSAQTNIFRGDDVRASAVNYVVFDKNGNSLPGQTGVDSFHLVDGFGVVTTKESVGFFSQPVKTETSSLELRAGLGAIQVTASSNQFKVDDATSTTVTVSEIAPYSEVGFEVGFEYLNQINETSKFNMSVEALYPFNTDKGTGSLKDKDDVEFTQVEGVIGYESKLSSWSSLKYQYKAIHQIKVVEEWQVQQDLTLNFSHDFLK